MNNFNVNKSSNEFNNKIIEYIDFFNNKLVSKGNHSLLITGIKISYILLAFFTVIGLFIPPSYKKFTIIYLVILGQIIILSILLKKQYLSVLVENLKDKNNNSIILIPNNLYISIWIVFFIISLNGLKNYEYSLFNLIISK